MKLLKPYLNATLAGMVWAIALFVILALAIGCADTTEVQVDQRPNVYNTYVTELYEQYQITNVTEQYITEEYYEVTNILGAQIEVVPLCPSLPGDFPEVLLRIDGTLVAYFAQTGNAKDARLIVVPENVLLSSTDNRPCKFKVINGQVKEM